MNHPLKVYNPAAGKYFLLQWWTHDEQCHIILAPSEKSLSVIAKGIFTDPDSYAKTIIQIMRIRILVNMLLKNIGIVSIVSTDSSCPV